MERLTQVTPNGVKVGDVEYTSPKEILFHLISPVVTVCVSGAGTVVQVTSGE